MTIKNGRKLATSTKTQRNEQKTQIEKTDAISIATRYLRVIIAEIDNV